MCKHPDCEDEPVLFYPSFQPVRGKVLDQLIYEASCLEPLIEEKCDLEGIWDYANKPSHPGERPPPVACSLDVL